MIDQKVKKATSVAYFTLFGFYLLFQIFYILHAYDIFPFIPVGDIYVSPVSLFLMFLYLCYCCTLFIFGSKMKLRGVGYAGVVIMTLIILYGIITSIYPFYNMIYDEFGIFRGPVIITVITSVIAVIELVGVLLFLLGTCTSVAMKILTPTYLLLALIINLVIFRLGDNAGWDYQISRTVASALDIIFMCAMLLPVYLIWNKQK